MTDFLDEIEAEAEARWPGFRAKVEAALAARRVAKAPRAPKAPKVGLSVRDAAALLGVTPAGLKLHDARLRPARDSSGRRTYDRAAVLAFKTERRAKANARFRRGRAS